MGRLTPTMPSPLRTAEDRADELVAQTLGASPHIDIVIPRTQVAGKMRLPKRSERFEATSAARQALKEAGFPIDATAATALGAQEQWHYELGVRLLAVAVRDPNDVSRPLASVEEWRECDDDQLDATWERFEDLQAQLDPMEAGTLSQADAIAIAAASKKKDVVLLMSFGSRKLALFATTSESLPANSTTSAS